MKSGTFIIPLDRVGDSDQSVVGAKAVGLASLKRLGLPVPDGFCIPAGAYRTHIGSLLIQTAINNAGFLSGKSENCDTAAVLAKVRQAIIDTPMDAPLAAQIERCYRNFTAGRLQKAKSKCL